MCVISGEKSKCHLTCLFTVKIHNNGNNAYCLDGCNDMKFPLEKQQVRTSCSVRIVWLLYVCLNCFEVVDRVRCGKRSKFHLCFLSKWYICGKLLKRCAGRIDCTFVFVALRLNLNLLIAVFKVSQGHNSYYPHLLLCMKICNDDNDVRSAFEFIRWMDQTIASTLARDEQQVSFCFNPGLCVWIWSY